MVRIAIVRIAIVSIAAARDRGAHRAALTPTPTLHPNLTSCTPHLHPTPYTLALALTPALHTHQVRVELPELSSAAGVELDITECLLCLAAPQASYALKLPLPYEARGRRE